MGITGFVFLRDGGEGSIGDWGVLRQGLLGLKGADLIRSLRTSQDKLQTQKSPLGLRRAGFQDFIG
jgi:hypothetical protein